MNMVTLERISELCLNGAAWLLVSAFILWVVA